MGLGIQEITKLGDKARSISFLLAPYTPAERELIMKMVQFCRNCGEENPGGNECSQCFEKD